LTASAPSRGSCKVQSRRLQARGEQRGECSRMFAVTASIRGFARPRSGAPPPVRTAHWRRARERGKGERVGRIDQLGSQPGRCRTGKKPRAPGAAPRYLALLGASFTSTSSAM
jgi:hypothetical protein